MLQRVRQSGAAALLAVAALAGPAMADVQMPNIFGNSMVLQQGQQNRVWGRAEPGEPVTVTIDSQTHRTTADDSGNWKVMIEPLEVGGPYTLAIQGKNKIAFDDVLVGEVWVCSGQSNMAWKVASSTNADLVKLTADHPKIRMINFPQTGSQQPIWTHSREWQVCTPETVGDFSAVGYFFARQLHETLDVPIGMINNAWGGSAVEAWIDRDTLSNDPRFTGLMERWSQMEDQYTQLAGQDGLNEDQKKGLANLMRQMGGNHRPANIYNGVLKSHLGYGIRGAIWYQGESNAGRAYQYRDLFPLMISKWREEWSQGDFPFYWVQLADFRAEQTEPGESDWAELREAQTMTMDKLPQTGEAVIIDLGEGKDIHPRNKIDVALRLSRWALANQYGVDVPYQSPRFKSMEIQNPKVVLTFDHVGPGWRPFDVAAPQGFAIAGEDRKFVWAQAKILADGRIEVWSDQIAEPVAVRYGWADNPIVNMYSQNDLPLTPFRTDDWDGVTKGKK